MAKVPLCPLDELAPGTARHFDVGRHRLAVVRLDDDV
jgi:nitrite reductase/ring-hydroxylating ferredoxin subunit